MRQFGLAFQIFLLATQLPAQTAAKKIEVSPLSKIYAEDQRDRGVALAGNGETMLSGEEANKLPSFGWDEINKRDAGRRK